MGRKFTEEEICYIKNNYSTKTIAENSNSINRPYKTVQRKLKQLGLEVYKKNPSRKWTEEEVKILQKKYRTTSLQKLSKELNRTECSIILKANDLGLYRRKWTEEEEDYLSENYMMASNKRMATKTQRSVNSIQRKLSKMNISRRERMYVKTIAKCFNSDSRVVTRWIEKFDLPCKRTRLGISIEADKFWKWAKEHKDLLPFYKYELYSILPQPSWVEAETKKICKTKNSRKKITDIERNYVYIQRKKGKSYEDISTDLGRSIDSIKHVYIDENKKRRQN